MKAVVYTKYGPPEVMQLKEVDGPAPGKTGVLVRVHAASVNALDYRRFEKISAVGQFAEERLLRTTGKVLGADIAGVVEECGAGVTLFKPGDEVFGVSAGNAGGFAEFACASENALALKPVNLSFEAAAAVPMAGLTALNGLRKGNIKPGQKVLIAGASGGVGTFAVQIARSMGAEVTAVCSTRNLETARLIGADHTVDYTRKDFTLSGLQYDLVIAVNGYHPLSAYKRALAPRGMYVCIGGTLRQIFEALLLAPWISRKGGKRLLFMGIAKADSKALAFLGELCTAGKVAPVIEKTFPLSEVGVAIRHIVEGHARAKLVIKVV